MHPSSIENMRRFAVEYVLPLPRPLAVLDVGSLSVNGDYRALFDDPGIRYTGLDVEAGTNVDVIVADGFSGNVLLKTCEGTAREAFRRVRAEATGIRAQLGGALLRPALRRVRDTLDPDTYGGGHLLGVNAVAIVVHGSARPHGIAQACRYAAEGVERNLVGAISARVS
jgi:glycerol-3-phosphate acyltransferase PlsX